MEQDFEQYYQDQREQFQIAAVQAGWSITPFKTYVMNKVSGLEDMDEEYWIDCLEAWGWSLSCTNVNNIDDFIEDHWFYHILNEEE